MMSPSTVQAPEQPELLTKAPGGRARGYYSSLDLMRLVAMTIVTVQHAASVNGFGHLTHYAGINVGRVGTGMFCALSGYFAFSTSAPASKWFWQRLARLMPAVWVSTTVAFGLVWLTAREPVTFGKYVSQMLATGYFTHGFDVLNLPTWFMSMIMLCYVMGYVAKLTPRPWVLLLIYAVVAAWLMVESYERIISQHVIEFCIAGLCVNMKRVHASIVMVIAGAVSLLLVPYAPHFLSPGLSLPIVALGLHWPKWSWGPAKAARGYIFEYYLVHGPALVGANALFPGRPAVAIPLGVLLAIGGAYVLRRVVVNLGRVMEFSAARIRDLRGEPELTTNGKQ